MSDSKPAIVISEFMDDDAVESLRTRHSVHYDPDLVDRPHELRALLAQAATRADESPPAQPELPGVQL